MAHVKQHRDALGGSPENVFDRQPTEGDAIRFLGAENGHRELFHTGSTAVTDDGTAKVTQETGSHKFILDFEYIVSANQIEVWVPVDTSTPLYLRVPSIDEKNSAETTTGFPGTPFDFDVYFEEIGSNSIRVYGLVNSTGVVLFTVPHTSIPAASRNRIVVEDQGDNKAIEFLGFGDGVVFRSPNGQRWLMRVGNEGAPILEAR